MKTKQEINLKLLEKFPFLELIGEYTGANNKSLVRCNDCGYEWEVVPRSVIASKHGCPKCKRLLSRDENSKNNFLQKYDLSKYKFIEFIDYMNVTVQCKKCGYLRTTNANNIYRYGCPKCGLESTHNHQRLSKEEFINKANIIHNNKYNYDKVEYINYSTPVIITCPIHGDFALTPGKHLIGSNGVALGCPKCVGRNKTTEDVIALSKLKHGDKYDYSKTKFVNNKTLITITCPKHGEFLQLPYIHYGVGCGCPKCSSSHGEEKIALLLSSLDINYQYQVRISNPYKENKHFILDFYLPDFETIIEYNGELHYMPVEKFGGEILFEKLLLRDNDLKKYCIDNNIKLLEIKYDEKDLLSIIKNFLNIAA